MNVMMHVFLVLQGLVLYFILPVSVNNGFFAFSFSPVLRSLRFLSTLLKASSFFKWSRQGLLVHLATHLRAHKCTALDVLATHPIANAARVA